MWPDCMKRETLAKRMDVEPGFVDQLVARGHIPPPRDIGGAPRWFWSKVEPRLRASHSSEVSDFDPYKLGAARAAQITAPRQARQKSLG